MLHSAETATKQPVHVAETKPEPSPNEKADTRSEPHITKEAGEFEIALLAFLAYFKLKIGFN